MDPISLIMIISLGLAVYLAWCIGANDVANSMATAVGSKAITARQAVLIAAVLEAAGAILLGSHVASTVRSGIVDPGNFNVVEFKWGMFSVILATCFWITLATWKEMPISTTHSVIGSLIGFGLVAGGAGSVAWSKLGQVVMSWLLSPLFGALLSFIIFKIMISLIFNRRNPEEAARKSMPFFLFATFMIIFSSLFLKTPLSKRYEIFSSTSFSLGVSALISIILSAAGYIILVKEFYSDDNRSSDGYRRVEAIFRKIQIMTSCYVAFAHGANDVANAIGPVAGLMQAVEGEIHAQAIVPIELLIIGGIGISLGVATWGHKVMKTIGSSITTLTNTRGFCVDFSAATTVLVASNLGMPISTSHTVVGAVVGVGIAGGIGAIDLGVIRKIIISWLLTVPIAAFTTIIIYLSIINLV